jgi:midasin
MRNRFTEIWVPPITSHHDLSLIVKERFVPPLVEFYSPVIDFVLWFRSNLLTSQKRTISLRYPPHVPHACCCLNDVSS